MCHHSHFTAVTVIPHQALLATKTTESQGFAQVLRMVFGGHVFLCMRLQKWGHVQDTIYEPCMVWNPRKPYQDPARL
ncbi:hypothetical protein ILYODFUR_013379 [Ilyodon furcidens]|uniref:Uncharacterized protein n=1 Tax=Ilyodon furcidens TaxID=33524 RepID=A0ABV0TU98_9TELE